MATSGTSAFTVTRDGIIDVAAQLLQAVGEGITMNDAMRQRFANALNAMVKRWQVIGLHVWTVSEATLFPQPSQVTYSIGSGMTDHVCATTAYTQTAITTAAVAGAFTIALDATTNITAADKIGILLDDGTLQWTTVVSKTTTTVLLTAALTDSAAAANYVFTYTSNIVRPLRVVAARRYDIASTNETPIAIDARLDYRALPNKTQTGNINRVFYDPQLTLGVMHLWNPIEVIDTLVNFTWWRPIQDFNAAGDNPDLPQEWIDTLQYNLAMVMAPQYSVPTEKYAQIKELALSFLDDMKGADREAESIFFGVASR